MTFVVRKQGSRWAIVKKETGETVGTSSSKQSAQKSANIRNAKTIGRRRR